MNEAKYLVKKITEGIQEKKGKNIVIADLSSIDDTICNYFVICQGNTRTYWCMSSCLKQGNSTIWSTYGQMPSLPTYPI